MGKKTRLYELHKEAGAKMGNFAGWEMPIRYDSQIEEHLQVRKRAGVFDVSHMTVIEIFGRASQSLLSKLLANDITRLRTPGKALYSAMLDFSGHVLDDLIVYYLAKDNYLLVVNCANREKDLAWLQQHIGDGDCTLNERQDLSILAIQGPDSLTKVFSVLAAPYRRTLEKLMNFQGLWCGEWFIARTGYTGEKGLEIMLPPEAAVELWKRLVSHGVQPIGLGARDTLRLEAGMNLYGNDLDETVTPYESNMASTVVMEERSFIGSGALRINQGSRRLVGLIMKGKGILRPHYPVFCDDMKIGKITSGVFSPTLGKSIALARVNKTYGSFSVEIRGKKKQVALVRPPFVRNGKPVWKAW